MTLIRWFGLMVYFVAQFRQPLGADVVDDAAQFLDLFTQPGQLLGGDPVMG